MRTSLLQRRCGQTSSDDPLGASSHDMTALYQREDELLTDQRFWGEFAAKEAAMFQHNESGRRDGEGETTSARHIVPHLIAESDKNSTLKVLRLQREIIDEKKTLGETAAGIAIAGDLYKARKEHEQQLLDLETELKERLAMADASHDEELQELKSEIQMTMAKAQEETKALQKSMLEMHKNEEKTWKDKIEALDKQFRQQIDDKELELEELEDSVRQIREEANILRWSAETQREFAEHTEIVRTASTEVVKARDAHSKFNSSMTNIMDELANKILDSVGASVITGGKLPSRNHTLPVHQPNPVRYGLSRVAITKKIPAALQLTTPAIAARRSRSQNGSSLSTVHVHRP
jgi:hypothetical protein